jgi:uncharacterized membrane protein
MNETRSTVRGPIYLHPLPPAAYVAMTRVLRVGLGIALVILFGALVAFGIENPGIDSTTVIAANPIAGYLSLPGLAGGLASGAPEAYLTLGILALLAVPIARVLAGFYFFQRNGEVVIARITFAVFVLLLVGLVVIGPLIR